MLLVYLSLALSAKLLPSSCLWNDAFHTQQEHPAQPATTQTAASDIYAPVSGKIEAVNSVLGEDGKTGLVNTSPYERGWIAKVRLSAPKEVAALLDAAAYEEHTKEA